MICFQAQSGLRIAAAGRGGLTHDSATVLLNLRHRALRPVSYPAHHTRTPYSPHSPARSSNQTVNEGHRSIREERHSLFEREPVDDQEATRIVARNIGLVCRPGNPQHERLRLQAIEAHKQPCRNREDLFDGTLTDEFRVQKVNHPRFVSQVRHMGRKRSFASHEDFLEYQKMAASRVHDRQSAIGFSLTGNNQKLDKKKNRKPVRKAPRWRHMATQDLKKSLFLSDHEKLLVRLPVRFPPIERSTL